MAKGKKKAASNVKKITLKVAKNHLKMTVDGKRRLDLSNMKIETFPKCLLKMDDVDELDLSRNMLRKIPDYIDRFLKLRWLDLHSNRIEELPDTIGRLPALCHLNLCNNCLTSSSIPAQIGHLSGLRSLNLGMNRLDIVPPCIATLRGLEELGLFDNQLTAVPESVQRLPRLRKLNAKRNPIAVAGQPSNEDRVSRVESLYLVREDGLCKPCLGRCREERQRLARRAEAPQRKANFSGLITPNSVARENQAVWR